MMVVEDIHDEAAKLWLGQIEDHNSEMKATSDINQTIKILEDKKTQFLSLEHCTRKRY